MVYSEVDKRRNFESICTTFLLFSAFYLPKLKKKRLINWWQMPLLCPSFLSISPLNSTYTLRSILIPISKRFTTGMTCPLLYATEMKKSTLDKYGVRINLHRRVTHNHKHNSKCACELWKQRMQFQKWFLINPKQWNFLVYFLIFSCMSFCFSSTLVCTVDEPKLLKTCWRGRCRWKNSNINGEHRFLRNLKTN